MHEDRSGDDARPIYLEITLDDPRLILSSFVAGHQGPVELEFQPTEGLGWDCAFVVVEQGAVDSVAASLVVDPTVIEADFLGSVGSDRRFRVLFGSGVQLIPPSSTEMGVRVISVRHENSKWYIQMHLPAHSTLHRVQEHYHDNDISFRVKRLHVARDTDVGSETALLPGQRKALLVAHENGYFEVPRRSSQGELATILGISKSGVSQRIRRAISRLIEATLSQ
ncbi:helix-turn-helix domain-containing protein [Haloferax sp. KTX1]|uniref:helix-turn-helix domain-containing protein n=1 Tax=Haloferax sp. KTX1 TaxID=2600597 RepID=UPI0011DDB65C|nr:helix-turn-helix domain-containing protein [Haloferax sp. KTX1]